MTASSQKTSGGRADSFSKSRWITEMDGFDRQRPAMPLSVKVVLVVLMINLLVASMLLMKLRVPHFG